MRVLFSIFLIAAMPHYLYAETLKMDMTEALKKNIIKLNAVNSQGRYTGKSMKLVMTNNNKFTVQIKVDMGAILMPEDTAYQPMVLAGGEIITIQPSKELWIEAETFCGNAPAKCPSSNVHYSYSHLANDTLIKVLQFIKDHSLYDHLGQYAVWAVTNNLAAANIYDPDRDFISNSLVTFVCRLTGQPMPTYYTVRPQTAIPDEPAYIPKALKIVASFEVLLEAPKTLTLGVFDGTGAMVQKVFENQVFSSSGHRFGVEFESADVPAGKYYIRLKEAGTTLQEKMVLVE